MLRESRQQVCDLILGANDTAAEDVVSELLTVLLRLSAEESIEDVSQIVCACLGELGAIDPARVSISLFDNRAARSAALTSSSYSTSVSTSSTPSSAPLLAPWHTNDSKMALELLEHMLVPKLRAATADKDRFPYAVQELLHLLYSRGMERLKTTGAEEEATHERGLDLEENGQRKAGASSGREGKKELALQPQQSDSRKGKGEEGQAKGPSFFERGWW
ncbi:hypothetical protein Naga_100012g20 [Nannochloropsis gaditana]|uniref:Uncharacterized protein n=1 Tax=Nannochloropsis gaditana TaxID=72520 RepID=W7T508_9STRA|nr:hypothetical protein Naga_100012g20 [Nannochloropsis gaditana]